MRVAVVHSFYTAGQPSGENSVVVDQVAQLERAGYDVQLVARRTDIESARRLYPLRAAVTAATGFGASPHATLKRINPDVVHLHNTFPNWGTRWLRAWKERSVVTLHNYRPICAAGTLFRDGQPCRQCLSLPAVPAVVHRCYRNSAVASVPLALASAPGGGLRSIVSQAGRVISLNEQSATIYRQMFDRAVDVVPNFVPGAGLMPVTDTWAYVGRLSQEKGIQQLLRLWPSAERLDVIGDGALAPMVQDVARNQPNIQAKGLLDRDDLLDVLGSYRGLVIPSVCAEQLPTIALEALSRGVPLIISSLIDAAKDMEDEGAAVTFDPLGDAANLEGALSRATGTNEAMRQSAVALHGARFSAAVWQRAIDEIYGEIGQASQ